MNAFGYALDGRLQMLGRRPHPAAYQLQSAA